MRRALLSVVILISSIACFAQNKHALLIGIGDYPASSGWAKIHGNLDIPIIRKALAAHGFQDEGITQLIDSQATKSAIVFSLESLAEKAAKGDIVYIHFSGHGQQITDLNGDEEDMFDEAWIPYDACKKYQAGTYEGENHLVDDDINKLISNIRDKVATSGKIIVVSDACHSGSGTRGGDIDEDEVVRGTGDKFILPDLSNRAGGKSIAETQSKGETNKVSTKGEIVPWLSVAACKDYQTNHEYKDEDGHFYGILTYIISTDGNSFTSKAYIDIIEGWKQKMYELSEYPQTLVSEGKPSKSSKTLF